MQTAIIAFSPKGANLGERLQKRLLEKSGKMGYKVEAYLYNGYAKEGFEPFASGALLVKDLFPRMEMLVFIASCGIAVRLIAPCLKGKTTDPGVVVIDEMGGHVISLLSGHLGGANAFCQKAASLLGAEPVITTATDVNGLFSVDAWAGRQGLLVMNPAAVKELSARLLRGEGIGFASELPVEGILPPGLVPCGTDLEERLHEGGGEENLHTVQRPEAGIYIRRLKWEDASSGAAQGGGEEMKNPFAVTCRLAPRDLVLGMGCKKGVAFPPLWEFVERVFAENHLLTARIGKLASIDAKAEEEGLLRLAAHCRVPFETYGAEELQAAEGSFSESSFVREKMGVGNVCERSACLGSGQGVMVLSGQAFRGMTLAVYQRKVRVVF